MIFQVFVSPLVLSSYFRYQLSKNLTGYLTMILLSGGRQTFYVKGQIVNILEFANHIGSVLYILVLFFLLKNVFKKTNLIGQIKTSQMYVLFAGHSIYSIHKPIDCP